MNNNKPAKRVDIVTVKLVRESSVLYKDRTIYSPADSVNLLEQFLKDEDRERFMVLCLDTKNQPTAIHTVSIGTLNSSVVHPREESIRQTLSLLEGTYALAFQNGRDPKKIWLVRGPGRPLVVGYDTRLETTWFASEANFILKAYKTSRIKTKDLKIHEMREGEILSLSQSSIAKRQKMV